MTKNTTWQCVTTGAALALAGLSMVCGSVTAVEPPIYPGKDGTLADGGTYGPLDGVADDADWYFNESSYEGSITLSTAVEHRVVWEYSLAGVTLGPPVSATLTFTIRGAPIWPFPDVDVHVYSYPADFLETMDDFGSGPTELQGSVTIQPNQDPTEYSLDVGAVVNEALISGGDLVAFRFQVDPGTSAPANQAFIDALDTDPTSKPYLTISEWVPSPGDGNGDGVVDLADYVLFADCMDGPEVAAAAGCEAFQLDSDTDVDLADFAEFQSLFLAPSS
ncbi:MAG: hypothetical protein JSV19_08600 [Phycisphaerales bacterium]|nr:MAG: hypothetical protein JSV19_08600 [Phycisphaerales bacterium]